MMWIVIILVVIFCILLSRVEDYFYFDYTEEAILIGKKKVVKIDYKKINLIERSLFSFYESDVSYYTYHFYSTDDLGNEVKFTLRRRGSLRVHKKWQRFKNKLKKVNLTVIINENMILDI